MLQPFMCFTGITEKSKKLNHDDETDGGSINKTKGGEETLVEYTRKCVLRLILFSIFMIMLFYKAIYLTFHWLLNSTII